VLRALLRWFERSPSEDGPVKVILGLGNPGPEYERTRHNVGWWVLDHLADVWRFDGWRKDGEARVAAGLVGPHKVRLVKPLTYYNLSGTVLRPYVKRPFWAAKTDLLVVADDVALPVGTIRTRARGSAGGSNGLKSIEGVLKSQEYPRLRVGTKPADERREVGKLSDFVLSEFGKMDAAEVRALFPRITEAAELWMREGVEAAMNKYNG
jgi:PTH1 family peptidyl-tRNA hydrolase